MLHILWSYFLNWYTPYKAVASATKTLNFLSKLHKHKLTWTQNSILDVAAVRDQPLQPSWEDQKKAHLQVLQKAVDLHRIFYILHEVISHSPPSVICIVEYCAFSLSSEVRFLESTFQSKLSKHIKCSRYQYIWLMST